MRHPRHSQRHIAIADHHITCLCHIDFSGEKGEGGETRNERRDAPLDLRDLHSRVLLSVSFTAGISGGLVLVSPYGISELRTLHLNDVRSRLLVSPHHDVNAGTQAKDEAGILGVQHQIATGQQDLARGGHCSRHDDDDDDDVGCSRSIA